VHKTKTVAALAVASAFAAPALAQVPSGVQLYGRLNLGVDAYEAKGSPSRNVLPGTTITCAPTLPGCAAAPSAPGSNFDYKSRMRVFDTASRVGIRGSEDLGGGFRAIFQIETGVNVDSGNHLGQNGSNNPNTGFWASRDSWVGIEGDRFGRLTFGRQSVYWSNGTIEQIGANYINSSSPLGTYSQSGIVLGPVARESNTVQYSLRFGGFSATASYGHSATAAPVPPATGGVSPYEAAQAGVDPKDQFYGITLRYNHSVFDLQADWATRQDILNTQGRDFTGWKVGAAWKYLPGAQISVVYQNLTNDNTFGLGAINGATPTNAALAVTSNPALGLSAAQAVTAAGVIAGSCGPVSASAAALAGAGIPAALIPGTIGAVQGSLFTTAGGGTIDRCANLKQDMWLVSWEHTFGNFQALAQYGWGSDVRGGSLGSSGVQSYLIGGRYFLSKRTWVYASYNLLKNDVNNYVDYWGGWMTSAQQLNGAAPGLPPTSSGADPQIIAVGLFHTF
jgi:predicted porin